MAALKLPHLDPNRSDKLAVVQGNALFSELLNNVLSLSLSKQE